MSELKPCPFCGSRLITLYGTHQFFVMCDDCGGKADVSQDKSAAVAFWNDRTPQTQSEEG